MQAQQSPWESTFDAVAIFLNSQDPNSQIRGSILNSISDNYTDPYREPGMVFRVVVIRNFTLELL